MREKSGGGNVKILLPKRNYKGLRGGGSKEKEPPSAWEGEIRRRKCEDFAPRNGVTRVSGEGGAKRKSYRATERAKSDGGNVKILLPKTDPKSLEERKKERD